MNRSTTQQLNEEDAWRSASSEAQRAGDPRYSANSRATCSGARVESFRRGASKQKYLSQRAKTQAKRAERSWPAVRWRSSAYDRYRTDIRDMICARCGGTRIPNKNINCARGGSKGKGEQLRNTESRAVRASSCYIYLRYTYVRVCVRRFALSRRGIISKG